MPSRSSILNISDQSQGAIQYLRSLSPSLLWTPGRNSKDGIDWSQNSLTPTAVNTGDIMLGNGPLPIIGGAPVCEFGGTNGYVEVPDNAALDLPSAFTLMMCLRFDALPAGDAMALIGKSDFGQNKRSWSLFYRADEQDFLLLTSSDGTTGTACNYIHDYTANTSDWITVFAVFNASQGNGDRQSVYVDGSLLPSTAVSDRSITPLNNDVPVAIGAKRQGGAYENYLSASVAIAGVFRSVLTSAQIQKASGLMLN